MNKQRNTEADNDKNSAQKLIDDNKLVVSRKECHKNWCR